MIIKKYTLVIILLSLLTNINLGKTIESDIYMPSPNIENRGVPMPEPNFPIFENTPPFNNEFDIYNENEKPGLEGNYSNPSNSYDEGPGINNEKSKIKFLSN